MALTTSVSDDGLRHFFIQAVGSAATNQHLNVQRSTVEYVGNLLARFSRAESFVRKDGQRRGPAALADLYKEAVEAPTSGARMEAFRQLGDVALFVAGLFSGSLRRRLVDVDYYVSMGQGAYGTIADTESNVDCPRIGGESVYAELADKFVGFVDVLDEIGEGSTTRSKRDVLRSYEVWLATGSQRERRRLERSGVICLETRNHNARH